MGNLERDTQKKRKGRGNGATMNPEEERLCIRDRYDWKKKGILSEGQADQGTGVARFCEKFNGKGGMSPLRCEHRFKEKNMAELHYQRGEERIKTLYGCGKSENATGESPAQRETEFLKR